jgi:hypothetical protein
MRRFAGSLSPGADSRFVTGGAGQRLQLGTERRFCICHIIMFESLCSVGSYGIRCR